MLIWFIAVARNVLCLVFAASLVHELGQQFTADSKDAVTFNRSAVCLQCGVVPGISIGMGDTGDLCCLYLPCVSKATAKGGGWNALAEHMHVIQPSSLQYYHD